MRRRNAKETLAVVPEPLQVPKLSDLFYWYSELNSKERVLFRGVIDQLDLNPQLKDKYISRLRATENTCINKK